MGLDVISLGAAGKAKKIALSKVQSYQSDEAGLPALIDMMSAGDEVINTTNGRVMMKLGDVLVEKPSTPASTLGVQAKLDEKANQLTTYTMDEVDNSGTLDVGFERVLRKGTTAEHDTFTGVAGEITVDTDKDTIVVHDGVKEGGFPLASVASVVKHYGLVKTSDVTTYDDTITEVDFGSTLDMYGMARSGTGLEVKRAGVYVFVCDYVFDDASGMCKLYFNINGDDILTFVDDSVSTDIIMGTSSIIRKLDVGDVIKVRVLGDSSWDDDNGYYLSVVEQ